MMRIPRLVIAGTHSGAGKTTITTALIAALTRRGLRVQPFKVGPDFIDPGFHAVASGRISRNLDGWMLAREVNLGVFGNACRDADVAVIEGVMGLFDARSADAEDGSTAQMAKWLGAPVVLVADTSAMARSVAALVGGYENFDPGLDLAGVLCNRVGGSRHADLLREALTRSCRAKPLGFLPRDEKIVMPSRHLGLQMAGETLTAERLEAMAAWIEQHVDLDGVVRLARERATELDVAPVVPRVPAERRARIGVARDAAFCFYYQDNLDLLAAYGAELVEFSPLTDSALPEVDGLYFGGGYPELHAERLAANQGLLESVRRFAQSGAPVYAECGGFMYLTEGIVDAEGREHAMAGLFPTRARMQSRLAALGYIEAAAAEDVLWLHTGERARGHQFRYSTMDPMPAEIARVYQSPAEGYRVHSVLGSYIHLHFLSCPGVGERFVEQCARAR